MARTLALLEGMLLFVVGCSMIVFWGHTHLSTWVDITVLLFQGFALSFCSIVSFYYNDLYDFRLVQSLGAFVSRLSQSFGVAFILLAGFYITFPTANIAGGPFISSLLIIVGLLLPLRAISYSVMRSQPFTERVLIIGTSPLAHKIIEEIEAQPHFRYAIAGVVDDTSSTDAQPPGYPLLGPLAHLGTFLQEVRPDRLIVALADRRGRMPVRELLEARSRRTLVEDGVEVYERLTGKLAIESLSPSNLIYSRDFLKSGLDLAVGRHVSLATSVVGLIALAPLLGLVALAIKLDSRGPVFFTQERVGRHGRRFTLIKFRTMHPASGRTSEWVQDNDDRITRLGKWLRKFRLDELPQFVNMLRGDMNLVGPRPHPVSNFNFFMTEVPYYRLRSAIRPGMTGWAQIRYGYANNLEEETEKMRYDLYYIKHRSFWFDLRILFDTVKIVLFGRGAQAGDAYRGRIRRPSANDDGPSDGTLDDMVDLDSTGGREHSGGVARRAPGATLSLLPEETEVSHGTRAAAGRRSDLDS